MRDLFVAYDIRDNGGRRSGIERRRFSYAEHIPERRSGEDRRVSDDRRSGVDRRCINDRRGEMDWTETVPVERRMRRDRRVRYDRRTTLFA